MFKIFFFLTVKVAMEGVAFPGIRPAPSSDSHTWTRTQTRTHRSKVKCAAAGRLWSGGWSEARGPEGSTWSLRSWRGGSVFSAILSPLRTPCELIDKRNNWTHNLAGSCEPCWFASNTGLPEISGRTAKGIKELNSELLRAMYVAPMAVPPSGMEVVLQLEELIVHHLCLTIACPRVEQ